MVACQKADWRNHKEACKSLVGSNWRSIRFDSTPKNAITIDNAAKALKRAKDGGGTMASDLPLTYIPEGIHNGKNFLVKIQVAYNDRATMLIYDQQRTFNMYSFRENDPALHREVDKIIGAPLKMYRWARRVSDNELEVCFDRTPSPIPIW